LSQKILAGIFGTKMTLWWHVGTFGVNICVNAVEKKDAKYHIIEFA